jgi:hypothetical protein
MSHPTEETLQFRHQSGLYRAQRHQAIKRGIEWHFTFEGWVAWWVEKLGPKWAEKRGRKADEYCMARKGDKGPYAPWNVECQTSRENCMARKRTKGSSKLSKDQVRTVLLAEGKLSAQFLAAHYGVSRFIIKNVWSGKSYKYIRRRVYLNQDVA